MKHSRATMSDATASVYRDSLGRCQEKGCKEQAHFFLLRPVRGYYCDEHASQHSEENEKQARTPLGDIERELKNPEFAKVFYDELRRSK